ncbi:helicase associated domain-containing protein [Rhodococcus antarcticus]|jgi:hypothetical protein|uniref:Helicase associated domain-containing protein n=1 Tax=Rhodococcus antarcticus TaxID=2987751 RepID=A0ABY6NX30_9NOCA|nr:helicase associated domain-containing protein [Rhodococcus antarcticus]UZJ23853.1 helicase associated domain-containing protein [Rhodococcus antarcticus]
MYGVHSDTWKKAVAALWSWAENHGDIGTLPPGVAVEGVVLSRWVSARRHERRTGELGDEQVTQLEALPGWSWGAGQQEAWATTFALLCAYAAENGTARVPTGHTTGGVRLGAWVSRQRTAHRSGSLPTDRAAALQRLAGWEWNPGS